MEVKIVIRKSLARAQLILGRMYPLIFNPIVGAKNQISHVIKWQNTFEQLYDLLARLSPLFLIKTMGNFKYKD